MSDAPKEAWIEFGEGGPDAKVWVGGSDVWLRKRPHYIRADLHAARIADLERQLAEALEVGLKVALRNGDLTRQLAEARDKALDEAAALLDAKCSEVLGKQDGRNADVDTNIRLVAVLLPDMSAAIRNLKGTP